MTHINRLLTLLLIILISVNFACCGESPNHPGLTSENAEEPEQPEIYLRLNFYGETPEELMKDFNSGIEDDKDGYVTYAADRIASDGLYVYVPEGQAEIAGYYIDIVPKPGSENSDLKEADVVMSCLYSQGDEAYAIYSSTVEDLGGYFSGCIGDYEYERTYGGVDVSFYGYTDGEQQYISVFCARNGEEKIWYAPNSSLHLLKTKPITWADVPAEDKFFDSLSEDFFRVKKISLSEYLI